jgi:hypothetical protein
MNDTRHDPVLLCAIVERRHQLKRTLDLMDSWALVFERIGRGEAFDVDTPGSRHAADGPGRFAIPVLASH